jgi:hypothetical protein
MSLPDVTCAAARNEPVLREERPDRDLDEPGGPTVIDVAALDGADALALDVHDRGAIIILYHRNLSAIQSI